jgi:hypothetical protein
MGSDRSEEVAARVWVASVQIPLIYILLVNRFSLISESRGENLICDQIIREKLKKYERIYIPKEVHQDGSDLSAAVQLERDGETSTEQ